MGIVYDLKTAANWLQNNNLVGHCTPHHHQAIFFDCKSRADMEALLGMDGWLTLEATSGTKWITRTVGSITFDVFAVGDEALRALNNGIKEGLPAGSGDDGGVS